MFASLTKLIDRPNAHIFNHLYSYTPSLDKRYDSFTRQLIVHGTNLFPLIAPLFPEKGRYVGWFFEGVQIYEGIKGESDKDKKKKILGIVNLIFSVITIGAYSLKPSFVKDLEVARSLITNGAKLCSKRTLKTGLHFTIDILNVVTLKYDSLECRTLSLFLQVIARRREFLRKDLNKGPIEAISKGGLILLCARNWWTELQALRLAYRPPYST